MEKPYSPACERNKAAILSVLKAVFAEVKTVLEFGSGTGQHAVHFAEHMPWLSWQTGDCRSQHGAILAWLADAQLLNCAPPLDLDVKLARWDCGLYDAVFTANTLHILSWAEVECFFEKTGEHLKSQGKMIIYGPFNYNGHFTSESNAKFDTALKLKDPSCGIRDAEAVIALSERYGFMLIDDLPMPANNRVLVLEKKA